MKTTVTWALSATTGLILGLAASAAHASEPASSTSAKTTVERGLIAPLAQKEDRQSRFSRAAIPARERSVRILDQSPRRDLRGAAFFAFSIDERRGWQRVLARDVLTGCVYPQSGEVFIKRGDSLYRAGLLLGKPSQKVEEQ